jgi:hypothetical protein
MATLKYFSEFDSLGKTWVVDHEGHVQYRFEIWDMEAVDGAYEPTHVYMSGDEPFVVHWEPAEKFQPIIASQATFTLMSEENFQFVDLFTDNLQRYQVRFFSITGGLSTIQWVGWLNTETYREHLPDNAEGENFVYGVEFLASDFNVLSSMKFLDVENGGGKYQGLKSYRWYLNLILRDRLFLTSYDPVVDISTYFLNLPFWEYCDHIFVNAANWYDEDGEAMSLWEVLEELLRPFGAFVYGYADAPNLRWLAKVTDYNRRLVSEEDTFTDVVHTMADSEGEFGIENMFNGLTITSSRYANNELQKWEAKVEDLIGLTSEETCYPYPGAGGVDPKMELMYLKRYSWCKGFNVTADVPLEYWYLKELQWDSKEEVWLCVSPGRGDSPLRQYPHLVFEDTNMLYPNDSSRLDLNMTVKIAQRDTYLYPKGTLPHLTFEEVNKYQDKIYKVFFYSRLECIGNDGTVNAHLKMDTPDRESVMDAYIIPKWILGADTSVNGEFPFMISTTEGNENNGLHNSAYKISYYITPGGPIDAREGFDSFPFPPKSGHLRWTIEYLGMQYLNGVPGDDTWGVLINNVEMTTTDASNKYELSTDDKVYTGVINKNAEREMDAVTLKVCTSYEDGMAPGKGDLFANVYPEAPRILSDMWPIPAAADWNDIGHEQGMFYRGIPGASGYANLERHLLRSYHANYTGLFRSYDITIQPLFPYIGWLVRYGRYMQGPNAGKPILPSRAGGEEDGWYFVRGQRIDFKGAKNTLHLIEIAADNEVALPPAGDGAPGADVPVLTVGSLAIASLARNREGYAQAAGGGTGAMIIQPAPAPAPNYWTAIGDTEGGTLYIETGNNVHVAGEGAFVEIDDKIIRSVKEGDTAQLQFTREVEEGVEAPLPWVAMGDVQLAGGVVRRTAINGAAYIQGKQPLLGFVKNPETSLPAGTEVKAGLRVGSTDTIIELIGDGFHPLVPSTALLGSSLGSETRRWKEIWVRIVNAVTVTISGALTAASAAISGVLTAGSARVTGSMAVDGSMMVAGNITEGGLRVITRLTKNNDGNVVTDMSLSNGMLTGNKGYAMMSLNTIGSGNVVTDIGYSNGVLTETRGQFNPGISGIGDSQSGSGNVVTSVTASGSTVYVRKGTLAEDPAIRDIMRRLETLEAENKRLRK